MTDISAAAAAARESARSDDGRFGVQTHTPSEVGLADRPLPEHTYTDAEVGEFTWSYTTTALWSSTDEEGTPLDSEYDEDDISPHLRRQMENDVNAFLGANQETLERVEETHGYSLEQAGHDFWLTRNGHGAGFWDRGLGEDGDTLTENAKAFGGVDLFVNDDGTIEAM